MAADFFCWTLNHDTRSACSYYRVEVPMLQLSEMGYAQVYEQRMGRPSEESLKAQFHSDIAHFYAVGGERFLHEFETIRKLKPAVRNGCDLYPPSIIYDIDDNNDFTHPFNPVFAHLGVRDYPDGRLLKPGDGLEITDASGKTLGGWVDGVTKSDGTTFDVARNLHQMKVRHAIVRAAHGATVGSESLVRYFHEVVKQPNVYFFPNTIIPEHYDPTRAVRTDPDVVRILWQGGQSHWVDWYPLREALGVIAKKYGQRVKFLIFGEWHGWIHEIIPDELIEHHPWVVYDAYKLKRGLLNVDINLCPLARNVFNAGKSAIKWYEGSIWERPEATLASNFGPYREIEDGKTGLLFGTPEEFVQKLSLLIEDADLRARLGAGARQWVLANRTPKATIPGLFDFYAETRARHRRELGRPVIEKPTLEQIKKAGLPLR